MSYFIGKYQLWIVHRFEDAVKSSVKKMHKTVIAALITNRFVEFRIFLIQYIGIVFEYLHKILMCKGW